MGATAEAGIAVATAEPDVATSGAALGVVPRRGQSQSASKRTTRNAAPKLARSIAILGTRKRFAFGSVTSPAFVSASAGGGGGGLSDGGWARVVDRAPTTRAAEPSSAGRGVTNSSVRANSPTFA